MEGLKVESFLKDRFFLKNYRHFRFSQRERAKVFFAALRHSQKVAGAFVKTKEFSTLPPQKQRYILRRTVYALFRHQHSPYDDLVGVVVKDLKVTYSLTNAQVRRDPMYREFRNLCTIYGYYRYFRKPIPKEIEDEIRDWERVVQNHREYYNGFGDFDDYEDFEDF